jgi:hypothetical protein
MILIVLSFMLLIESGCAPKTKTKAKTPTGTDTPLATGTLIVNQFQGKPQDQWNINVPTGSIKTNSNHLAISGSCPSSLVDHIGVLIDGSDLGISASCTDAQFNLNAVTTLSDNWVAPGNNGFGYKIELVPYDQANTVLSTVAGVTLYTIIKSIGPDPLSFTDATFYINNSLVTRSLNSGNTINITPDLNSGGSGNLCTASQAEIRINGSYSPASSDLPLVVTPVLTSGHSGNQFQFRICMIADEIMNLQISHSDSFGNTAVSPLSLAVHFQFNSSLDTVIPGDLASSFTTQNLAPDFAGLTSNGHHLVHIFAGVSESAPALTSTGTTGWILDFDFNHYITKAGQ